MNFLSVVRAITTPQSVKDEKEAKEKAELILKQFEVQEDLQHYNVWSAMPQSKALLNELMHVYDTHIQKAKDLALRGEETSSLLIQATTIEKVIKYVRTRESIIPSNNSK